MVHAVHGLVVSRTLEYTVYFIHCDTGLLTPALQPANDCQYTLYYCEYRHYNISNHIRYALAYTAMFPTYAANRKSFRILICIMYVGRDNQAGCGNLVQSDRAHGLAYDGDDRGYA